MRGSKLSIRRAFLLSMALTAGVVFSAGIASAQDAFDWRNVNGQNWVTSVKNQGGAGTCWDFAACGILEAKYMLTRNDTTYQPDLSEQQAVCAGVGGVDGGNAADVDNYAVSTGIVLESELPYTEQSSSPNWPLAAGVGNRVFKATSVHTTISQGTSLNTVKNALRAYGPLTVHCEVPGDWYNLQDGSGSGNHEVVIVGYHDNLPGENAPGGGYFIIKNSWGWWWNGDGNNNGYGQISYAATPSYSDWSWVPFYPDNREVTGITGQVYYTGAMATVTWNGGATGTWTSGGNTWSGVDQYGNSLPSYGWENKETTAVFNTAGGTVSLSGTVIAHGVTINSGATGYVFNGVSGGALTVTSAGIQAHESATINASVTIGAPQSWTVDGGKSLTIGGDLHTIISHLTINGDGDTTIGGSINGGGAANAVGMAPGTITKNGTGSLRLTGAGTYSVPISATGYISFEQNGSDVANFANSISGNVTVTKSNSGLAILSGANSYTGWTRIYGGATLQANLGVGLPNASSLILNGGVFQSNSEVTYTDKFRNETSGTARWLSWWDGGFAGGGGKMTVNLRNNRSEIVWTGHGDTGIANVMVLNSATAQYEVEIQNNINLNGAERTIYVADNPNSAGDFATISGSLVVPSGDKLGGINKTGPGLLVLTGTGNQYGDYYGDTGRTIISEGALQAANGVVPGDSCIQLDGGVFQSNGEFNRGWYDNWYNNNLTWNSGGFAANGGGLTVNINTLGGALTWTGNGHNGIAGAMVLSSTSADSEVVIANDINLNGAWRTIRVDDNPFSTGDSARISGAISNGAIEKTGAGTLTLSGSLSYGGGTTVNGGTLVVLNASNASFLAANIVNNGAVEINDTGVNGNYSGVISGSGSSLTKTGTGTVYLSGAASNTFSGTTVIAGGTLVLAKTSGAVAIAGNVFMTDVPGGGSSYLVLNGDNQIASTSVVSFENPNAWGHFDLNGHTQTLAGISDSDTWGVIEGSWDNTGVDVDSVLIVNNSAPRSFNGHIRDKAQGSGTGRLKLVKSGGGTLALSGPNCGSYTGGLTVNAGMLYYNNGTLPSCDYSVAGGNLSCGTLSQSISAFLMTGGSVTGSGTLTSSSTYDLRAGTINVGLGGSAGLSKSTTGTVSLTRALPSGAYTISGGTLSLSGLSQSISSLQMSSGSITGVGTLTSSSAYELQGGTLNIYLGGGAGLNKTTSGTVSIMRSLPGGDYSISGGSLSINSLSQSISSFRITGGTVTGQGTLTSSSAYDLQNGTVSVSLGGTAGLNKSTAGVVSMTKNLPGGDYVVSGGTLNTNAFSQSLSSLQLSGGTISGTGTLTSSSPYDLQAGNIDVNLGGSAGLNKSTSEVVSLTKSLPGGGYTISNGSLNINGLSQSISSLQMTGGTLSGTGTLTSGTAYDIQAGTVNAVLAGSVGLTKSSSNSATVNNPTYTGTTNIQAGTLAFTNGMSGGAYVVAGGVLNIGSVSKTVASLQLANGMVTATTGTLSSNTAFDVQAGTINAILGGSSGLTKTTSGYATVSSPMYTGTTSVQAGTLAFTSSLPGGNYTVSGGTLNINSLSKAIGAFQITGGVVSGTGTLTSNAPYGIQGGTVSAKLGGTSIGVNKTGSGKAVLSGANTYSGLTTVAAGILELGSAAQNAVFNLGGANIQGGRLVFDYSGTASPAATILSLLTGSYDGGRWDTGKLRSSTAWASGLTLGWFDNGTSNVTVRPTYAGDFNLDGTVDIVDLNVWKANLGRDAGWQAGDANYDGAVDGLDLDVWKAHLGMTVASDSSMSSFLASDAPAGDASGNVAVPEPGTLAMLIAGLIGAFVCARRKRS